MTTVERVLLAGASGQTGQQVLRQLARTDIDVRALTRSAEKTDRLQRHGADDVAVGNLMISDDARTAVEGMDAVFTAVGSSPQKVLR
ncbi:MAG: NAD(P)H-binding protein, partial [Halobacteriaceae archaeon]